MANTLLATLYVAFSVFALSYSAALPHYYNDYFPPALAHQTGGASHPSGTAKPHPTPAAHGYVVHPTDSRFPPSECIHNHGHAKPTGTWPHRYVLEHFNASSKRQFLTAGTPSPSIKPLKGYYPPASSSKSVDVHSTPTSSSEILNAYGLPSSSSKNSGSSSKPAGTSSETLSSSSKTTSHANTSASSAKSLGPSSTVASSLKSSSSASTIPTATSNPTCASGNFYTVISGDNCEKIAEAQKVSTGTLIATNSLPESCASLFIGQKLCLPQTCKTHVVQSGNTCTSLAADNGISFAQIRALNPILDAGCTNLILGQNICVGDLASTGGNVGGTLPATATTSSSAPTSTSRGETSGEGMSSATQTIVTPPTSTPTGTTAQCYQYYTVVSMDTCFVVGTKTGVTFSDLRFWNPSLDASCTNLLLGEAYCVKGARQPTG